MKRVQLLTDQISVEGQGRPDAAELEQLCVAAVEGAIMMARVQQTWDPLIVVRAQLAALLSMADRP